MTKPGKYLTNSRHYITTLYYHKTAKRATTKSSQRESEDNKEKKNYISFRARGVDAEAGPSSSHGAGARPVGPSAPLAPGPKGTDRRGKKGLMDE